MRAKTYLYEIRKLDLKIENKQMQIQSLYDLLLSVGVSMEEEKVQSSHSQDPLGNAVVRIVDLKEEINADIDRYVDRKLEAIRLINKLENDESINILFRRYIKYEEWQTIADELHFSRQAIDKKHKRALVEFQKIVDTSLHEFT